MNAGFWRRYMQGWIDGLLSFATLGVYFVFRIIWFCSAKPTLGMKAMSLSYSTQAQLSLFGFRILSGLFYMLFIPMIYDLVMICMKKGTFAERWSGNFIVVG